MDEPEEFLSGLIRQVRVPLGWLYNTLDENISSYVLVIFRARSEVSAVYLL